MLGESRPYHPLGLAPAFLSEAASLGLSADRSAAFDEIVAIRAERAERVRTFLASATDADLARPRPAAGTHGYPPPGDQTVLSCLHVVMDEEWNHHQYAVRDLATLTAREDAPALSRPGRTGRASLCRQDERASRENGHGLRVQPQDT